MSGTTINPLTGDQFASRIADLFPRGWAGDSAKQPGGNVYALFLAVGNELSIVQTELQYALNAQRLQTETFPELDFASIDYLGETLPRPPGASDATFEQLIVAALFQPAATRSALQNALTALTGSVPRMLEPWSVNDTGHWGGGSYWNVDTVANPARWGNGGLRYQGFIETAEPQIPAIGPNNPIRAWGDSAYWNVPGYFFGIIPPVDLNAVDNLINRLRAYGTIVWFKIVSPSTLGTIVVPAVVTNIAAMATGTSTVVVSWSNPTTGTPPFSFQVLYRQSGTTTFITGPTVSVNSTVVQNLAANIQYDFAVVSRNPAGSATSDIVTTTTIATPPSPAQNLIATLVQSTAITLSWSPPATGSPPFTYSVNYRVTGTTIWQNMIVGLGALAVTIINLIPNTSYDLEVLSSN